MLFFIDHLNYKINQFIFFKKLNNLVKIKKWQNILLFILSDKSIIFFIHAV